MVLKCFGCLDAHISKVSQCASDTYGFETLGTFNGSSSSVLNYVEFFNGLSVGGEGGMVFFEDRPILV